MIKIENTQVYGWEPAIRGMRNPMNSWDKSDSGFLDVPTAYNGIYINYQIGKADLELMQRLCRAGTDHRKFMRMITVSVDVTAPFYWWKEYDTYKVGTVANSCSTMHKLTYKPFEISDFSYEKLLESDPLVDNPLDSLNMIIQDLNQYRQAFLDTKDKKYWYYIIQLLPSSYQQKRTLTLNYEVLSNMYFSRKSHKLDEWHTFCDWILILPYARELILQEKKEEK